jgi:hypothetical protein
MPIISLMRQVFDGALSPTPHHYQVIGRAAEIARTLGSPVDVQPWGAEVAFEMGDSYLGLEHALLSMIRARAGAAGRLTGRGRS